MYLPRGPLFRTLAATAIVLAAAGLLQSHIPSGAAEAPSAADSCTPGSLRDFNVVAHHDDDVLFMNPDISQAIRQGHCVRTAYLAASDYHDADREAYMLARERGLRAAYAQAAGLPASSWTSSNYVIANQTVVKVSLGSQVSILEFRLPDNGSQYDSPYGNVLIESLKRLYNNGATLHDFYGVNRNWTKATLTAAVKAAVQDFAPQVVRTMDPSADQHNGLEYYDFHNDHVVVAKITDDVMAAIGTGAQPVHYRDYTNRYAAQNLTAAVAADKLDLFRTFAFYDEDICGPAIPRNLCTTSGFYYQLNFNQNVATAAAMLPYVPAVSGTPAHSVTPVFQSRRLSNPTASLCLTLPHAYENNYISEGKQLTLGSCNTRTPEPPNADPRPPTYFTLVGGYLKLDKVNECVGVTGGPINVGTAVILSVCTGAANQAWSYDSVTKTIINTASNLVIGTSGGSLASGTGIVLTAKGASPTPDQVYEVGGGIFTDLASAFDNVGITDDLSPTFGEFDGEGSSYSAQSLALHGALPGHPFTTSDGVTFLWPASAAGTTDNVAADGQLIKVTGRGSRLALLGADPFDSDSSVATVTYTDGTTSTGTLDFPNWLSAPPYPGGATAAILVNGRNTPTGPADLGEHYGVYEISIPITATKTVASITLPSSSNAHVFALEIAS